MPGPVALTGATGFIGRNLLAALLGRGHDVRALTRSPQQPAPGLTWIPGTLADPDALSRLVEGASHVIHCAGTVRGASAGHFTRINAEGTKNLLSAVRRQDPVPAFLLVSSLAAREPRLSWYAASKAAAEQFVRESGGGTPWTILRPPAVYGPGDREIRPLLRAMHRGWLPLSAPPGARFSLLHVSDLAAAVLSWLDRPACGALLELDDGTPGGYDWTAIRAIAEAAWQRHIRVVRLPRPLLQAAAGTSLLCAQLLHRQPMLTPGKVRELTHEDWVCDNTAITRTLGWQPRVKFADALRQPGLVEL